MAALQVADEEVVGIGVAEWHVRAAKDDESLANEDSCNAKKRRLNSVRKQYV
jgi:hypothetical protein